MARKTQREYVAVNGKLLITDKVAEGKLLHAMRLFRDAVKMAHHLIKVRLDWNNAERRLTSYISNAHYAHSA